MTNVSGNILKSFRNFYQEKFNQWQPTPIHVTLPSLFKNEYFLNVRNYVKNNGEDGIIDDFKNDRNFSILKGIKNEITKDLLSCVLSIFLIMTPHIAILLILS